MAERKFLKQSIDVTVIRYFTNVDGTILDKASLLIPLLLRTHYPFYMFGAFDMAGGYKIGLVSQPPTKGVSYLMTFINGAGQSSLSVLGSPSGLNEIQGKLNIGDIVHVYTDSFSAPTTYVWIVQQCDNLPLASIIENTKTMQEDDDIGHMTVKEINYTTANVKQWNVPLRISIVNNIGDYRSKDVQPVKWLTPQNGLNGILNLKVRFSVNQYTEFCSYIHLITDSIQFTFILEDN